MSRIPSSLLSQFSFQGFSVEGLKILGRFLLHYEKEIWSPWVNMHYHTYMWLFDKRTLFLFEDHFCVCEISSCKFSREDWGLPFHSMADVVHIKSKRKGISCKSITWRETPRVSWLEGTHDSFRYFFREKTTTEPECDRFRVKWPRRMMICCMYPLHSPRNWHWDERQGSLLCIIFSPIVWEMPSTASNYYWLFISFCCEVLFSLSRLPITCFFLWMSLLSHFVSDQYLELKAVEDWDCLSIFSFKSVYWGHRFDKRSKEEGVSCIDAPRRCSWWGYTVCYSIFLSVVIACVCLQDSFLKLGDDKEKKVFLTKESSWWSRHK